MAKNQAGAGCFLKTSICSCVGRSLSDSLWEQVFSWAVWTPPSLLPPSPEAMPTLTGEIKRGLDLAWSISGHCCPLCVSSPCRWSLWGGSRSCPRAHKQPGPCTSWRKRLPADRAGYRHPHLSSPRTENEAEVRNEVHFLLLAFSRIRLKLIRVTTIWITAKEKGYWCASKK